MIFLQAPQSFDPDIAREFGNAAGASDINFLGVPLFDATSLWTLLFRFLLNFLVCWIITRFFYYKKSQRRDYYFTFMMFAVVIFLIITLMDNMKMNVAYALGLFAIFGMIRYRTETLRIREMTYLFMVMGVSIINGQALTTSYVELFITNALVILAVWIFEGNKHFTTGLSWCSAAKKPSSRPTWRPAPASKSRRWRWVTSTSCATRPISRFGTNPLRARPAPSAPSPN